MRYSVLLSHFNYTVKHAGKTLKGPDFLSRYDIEQMQEDAAPDPAELSTIGQYLQDVHPSFIAAFEPMAVEDLVADQQPTYHEYPVKKRRRKLRRYELVFTPQTNTKKNQQIHGHKYTMNPITTAIPTSIHYKLPSWLMKMT